MGVNSVPERNSGKRALNELGAFLGLPWSLALLFPHFCRYGSLCPFPGCSVPYVSVVGGAAN